MKIHRGTSPQTAFEVQYKVYESHKVDEFANSMIDQMFGQNDGEYMILNQQVMRDIAGNQYKIYLIEDMDKDKHSIFFKMVPVGSHL